MINDYDKVVQEASLPEIVPVMRYLPCTIFYQNVWVQQLKTEDFLHSSVIQDSDIIGLSET